MQMTLTFEATTNPLVLAQELRAIAAKFEGTLTGKAEPKAPAAKPGKKAKAAAEEEEEFEADGGDEDEEDETDEDSDSDDTEEETDEEETDEDSDEEEEASFTLQDVIAASAKCAKKHDRKAVGKIYGKFKTKAGKAVVGVRDIQKSDYSKVIALLKK